jgi:hypothetical protein
MVVAAEVVAAVGSVLGASAGRCRRVFRRPMGSSVQRGWLYTFLPTAVAVWMR